MPRAQRQAIERLFTELEQSAPLIQPSLTPDGVRLAADAALYAGMADRIHRHTGLAVSPHHYAGWLGLVCASVNAAVWMMRALVVSNVLARREGVVLFVAVNPAVDPNGGRVAEAVVRLHRLAMAHSALQGSS
jgi:hypothetical protein